MRAENLSILVTVVYSEPRTMSDTQQLIKKYLAMEWMKAEP